MNESQNIDSLPKHVKKYLTKQGMDKWKLEILPSNKFKFAVVVPAIMEFENIKRLLTSLIHNDKTYFDKTVILFVINNLHSSDAETKADNKESLKYLRDILTGNERSDDTSISEVIKSGLNIGLIDAATGDLQFEKKSGGVGLARKIGMDLALTIFDYGDSGNKNILVCLDADCEVDSNYITEIYNSFQSNNFAGAYIKFRHKIYGDETVHLAMTCYELYMRYYMLGLKTAGSHYAFHTVGSTLVCDAESYIKIGGMSKHKGGEDFYFMEKLAKVGNIGYIDTTTVYPAGRKSWRVPFGTGPRVQRFSDQTHDEYNLYSLKSFLMLKDWLSIFHSEQILTASEYLEAAENIDPSIRNFLLQNSFKEEWGKICDNSKTEDQINKQKYLWFDGFRTLKLIHYLRDNGFPNENMFDVLDKMLLYLDIDIPIMRKPGTLPQLDDQLIYLKILRELA